MAGSRKEKGPRLTVDAWIEDRRGRVLLVRRGRPPFEGSWALPGGFCEWGETTEATCAREAKEETGVAVEVGGVLGVYSDPKRDSRGHTVSVLYRATPVRGRARGGDDAAEARWFAPEDLARLDFAFDHAKIVREQFARRRGRGRSAINELPVRPTKARSRRARRGVSRG